MIGNQRHNDTSAAPPEDAYVLPFGEFFQVLWKRAWIIVLAAIVSAGAAVGFSISRQPIYEASIQVLVGQEQGLTETATDIGELQDLTATMTVLVSNRTLAEEVIQQEGLQISPDTFKDERLSVSQIEESQVIEVSYQDTDSQRTQRVANTIGEVFSERIGNLNSGASAITATVVEPAVAPGEPISPNPLRDGLLAALLGAVLGAGIILLLELLDDRWRSPEELEKVSGVPVFGIIPHFEAPKTSKKGKG